MRGARLVPGIIVVGENTLTKNTVAGIEYSVILSGAKVEQPK